MSPDPTAGPRGAQLLADVDPAEADTLTIAETLRIMDVASSLRRERELVEREFSADEMRQGLREKLRAVAETTGESIGDEEIEAAINWYYRNLHAYREPKWSTSLLVAHLWIRRRTILGWTLFAAIVIAIAWWWFG